MDFEKFKETMKDNIREYLPDSYRNAKIDIHENTKINETYTGLFVQKPDERITPTINLDQMYEAYDRGDASIDELLTQAAEMIQQEPIDIDVHRLTDYDQARSGLFIRVCAIAGNEQMLAQVPHEKMEDLAMTYHIAADISGEGVASTVVSYSLMNQLGISQEQLKADALENSPKIFPPKVQSMSEMMRGILTEDMKSHGMPQDEIDAMVDSMIPADDGNPMTVVTNDRTVNGAAVMFYPEQMEKLGEQIGGDFFILPSSVHEMLVIPDNGSFQQEELKAMVTEVNATQVSPADRLTDEVYHFDTKDRVFEKAQTFEDRQKEKAKAHSMEQGGKKDQTLDQAAKPKKHKSNDVSL